MPRSSIPGGAEGPRIGWTYGRRAKTRTERLRLVAQYRGGGY